MNSKNEREERGVDNVLRSIMSNIDEEIPGKEVTAIFLHNEIGYPERLIAGNGSKENVVKNFDDALDMARDLLGEIDTTKIENEDGIVWFPRKK